MQTWPFGRSPITFSQGFPCSTLPQPQALSKSSQNRERSSCQYIARENVMKDVHVEEPSNKVHQKFRCANFAEIHVWQYLTATAWHPSTNNVAVVTSALKTFPIPNFNFTLTLPEAAQGQTLWPQACHSHVGRAPSLVLPSLIQSPGPKTSKGGDSPDGSLLALSSDFSTTRRS